MKYRHRVWMGVPGDDPSCYKWGMVVYQPERFSSKWKDLSKQTEICLLILWELPGGRVWSCSFTVWSIRGERQSRGKEERAAERGGPLSGGPCGQRSSLGTTPIFSMAYGQLQSQTPRWGCGGKHERTRTQPIGGWILWGGLTVPNPLLALDHHYNSLNHPSREQPTTAIIAAPRCRSEKNRIWEPLRISHTPCRPHGFSLPLTWASLFHSLGICDSFLPCNSSPKQQNAAFDDPVMELCSFLLASFV